MQKYWRVIWIFFRSSLLRLVIYPQGFVSGSLIALYWFGLSIVSLSVLAYQAESVGGWSKYQLFLVQGIYSIVISWYYAVFSQNISAITEEVWEGKFDYKLLKPIDAQFLSSFGYFRLHNIVRGLSGVVLILYAVSVMKLDISIWQIGAFIVFVLVAIGIVYLLGLMLVQVAFWSPPIFNLTEIVGELISLSRYPLIIFQVFGDVWVYLLLPLVVITTVPAQILIGKPSGGLMMASIVILFGLFILNRQIWKRGLQAYNSVG